MRPRLVLVPLIALALVVPAATTEAGSFSAHLSAPNHRPLANKLWYIKVSATSASGKPLKAVAWYEFYYAGQKVATRNPSPKTPCDSSGGPRPLPFTGSYKDGILWPPRSIGIPLTFTVAVKVKGLGVKRLNWKVSVRKSSFSHCTR